MTGHPPDSHAEKVKFSQRSYMTFFQGHYIQFVYLFFSTKPALLCGVPFHDRIMRSEIRCFRENPFMALTTGFNIS